MFTLCFGIEKVKCLARYNDTDIFSLSLVLFDKQLCNNDYRPNNKVTEVKFSAHKLSFTICYYYWKFFWYYIITTGLTDPNYYIDLCLLYEYIHMQYKKHPTIPALRCIFNFTIQCVYSSQAQGGVLLPWSSHVNTPPQAKGYVFCLMIIPNSTNME